MAYWNDKILKKLHPKQQIHIALHLAFIGHVCGKPSSTDCEKFNDFTIFIQVAKKVGRISHTKF